MATTNLEIAGGQLQKSKPRIARHGAGVVARPNRKVAAEKFPFRFKAIRAQSKKDGGGWAVEDFE